jgi:hypothetical protein
MLLVRLGTVTYWLCSKLYEAIVELSMCPIESYLELGHFLEHQGCTHALTLGMKYLPVQTMQISPVADTRGEDEYS